MATLVTRRAGRTNARLLHTLFSKHYWSNGSNISQRFPFSTYPSQSQPHTASRHTASHDSHALFACITPRVWLRLVRGRAQVFICTPSLATQPDAMRCADIYAFSTAACTYVTISTRIRSLSTPLSVRQMSVRLIWPQLTICTDTLALRVPLVSSRSASCREYLTFTSSSTRETYAVTFAHMRHSC